MLIICENNSGDTPARAVPAGVAWDRYAKHLPAYVRFNGTTKLPAGVYFQRYQPMWEPGRRDPFYVAQPLYLDDLVQETASVDHPGNQP